MPTPLRRCVNSIVLGGELVENSSELLETRPRQEVPPVDGDGELAVVLINLLTPNLTVIADDQRGASVSNDKVHSVGPAPIRWQPELDQELTRNLLGHANGSAPIGLELNLRRGGHRIILHGVSVPLSGPI
jgi:hypothetical protein